MSRTLFPPLDKRNTRYKYKAEGLRISSEALRPNKGVMTEAIARFGDPKRIFPAKVMIPL